MFVGNGCGSQLHRRLLRSQNDLCISHWHPQWGGGEREREKNRELEIDLDLAALFPAQGQFGSPDGIGGQGCLFLGGGGTVGGNGEGGGWGGGMCAWLLVIALDGVYVCVFVCHV